MESENRSPQSQMLASANIESPVAHAGREAGTPSSRPSSSRKTMGSSSRVKKRMSDEHSRRVEERIVYWESVADKERREHAEEEERLRMLESAKKDGAAHRASFDSFSRPVPGQASAVATSLALKFEACPAKYSPTVFERLKIGPVTSTEGGREAAEGVEGFSMGSVEESPSPNKGEGQGRREGERERGNEGASSARGERRSDYKKNKESIHMQQARAAAARGAASIKTPPGKLNHRSTSKSPQRAVVSLVETAIKAQVKALELQRVAREEKAAEEEKARSECGSRESGDEVMSKTSTRMRACVDDYEEVTSHVSSSDAACNHESGDDGCEGEACTIKPHTSPPSSSSSPPSSGTGESARMYEREEAPLRLERRPSAHLIEKSMVRLPSTCTWTITRTRAYLASAARRQRVSCNHPSPL